MFDFLGPQSRWRRLFTRDHAHPRGTAFLCSMPFLHFLVTSQAYRHGIKIAMPMAEITRSRLLYRHRSMT